MKNIRAHDSRLKINKLFLIGNGFDLSLNLRTSYNDFLFWLLKKHVKTAINSEITVAPPDKYKGTFNEIYRHHNSRRVYGFSENELFDVLLNKNITIADIDIVLDINKFLDLLNKRGVELSTKVKNGLISQLLLKCEVGWVDVEGVYFESLKGIIKAHKAKPESKILDSINLLNKELSCLILELKSYLKEIEISITKDQAEKYLAQFKQDLFQNDFSFLDANIEGIKLGEVYFLNFNYTDSLTNLLSYFSEFNFTQNFIHGNLEELDNSIIFGFGDEMDSVYKEMEELNDNRFFEHIKSFQYFKTSNYRKLLSFLNSGDYQVCIYGHSCGLSDRIMLNEIFEHDNCKSIRIYYYNDNDFSNKTMEISRHFNSNQVMRKKIVEKSIHDLIPQIIDMVD